MLQDWGIVFRVGRRPKQEREVMKLAFREIA